VWLSAALPWPEQGESTAALGLAVAVGVVRELEALGLALAVRVEWFLTFVQLRIAHQGRTNDRRPVCHHI
jgi:hypothetical protein